jgi:3-oxoacyl-[acyl-carrier protein] reductase
LTIVITGCSKGIGLELVKIWAEDHLVYGISRDSSKLKELKSSLRYPENFNFLAQDITKINSEFLDNWILEDNIDLLVNNAGMLINKPFTDVQYSDYRKLMDVNFWGTFNISQIFLKKLSNAKGQIINISSMGGVNYSSKFPGLSLYSSSKAAISVLTECLAEELKDLKIRVNALALGAVQTEMLNKAFPGYKSETTAREMATFIDNFINSSSNLLSGQVLRISKSNP